MGVCEPLAVSAMTGRGVVNEISMFPSEKARDVFSREHESPGYLLDGVYRLGDLLRRPVAVWKLEVDI